MSDPFKSENPGPATSIAIEAEEVTFLTGEDLRVALDDVPPTALDEARARAQIEVERLQDEVYLLKDRLATLRARAKGVIETQRTSINASAHAQLGDYPWAKLAAASIATYGFARIVRYVPLGLVATLVIRRMAGDGRSRH